MDKLLYIASSGANQDLVATSLRANNLANAQTNGRFLSSRTGRQSSSVAQASLRETLTR